MASHGWDSDEDDDSTTDFLDQEHRRIAGTLFGDMDDERNLIEREHAAYERALAAQRAMNATRKIVPSKEAIASLEKVDIKGLEGEEKCKSFQTVQLFSHISACQTAKFSRSRLMSRPCKEIILTTASMHNLLQRVRDCQPRGHNRASNPLA